MCTLKTYAETADRIVKKGEESRKELARREAIMLEKHAHLEKLMERNRIADKPKSSAIMG